MQSHQVGSELERNNNNTWKSSQRQIKKTSDVMKTANVFCVCVCVFFPQQVTVGYANFDLFILLKGNLRGYTKWPEKVEIK